MTLRRSQATESVSKRIVQVCSDPLFDSIVVAAMALTTTHWHCSSDACRDNATQEVLVLRYLYMHLVDAESEPKESANGFAVAYAARFALNAATGPGVN